MINKEQLKEIIPQPKEPVANFGCWTLYKILNKYGGTLETDYKPVGFIGGTDIIRLKGMRDKIKCENNVDHIKNKLGEQYALDLVKAIEELELGKHTRSLLEKKLLGR